MPDPAPTPSGPSGPSGPSAPSGSAAVVAETERWFRAHGLSYFVPGVRDAVRRGLSPRRFVVPLLAVLVAAALASWLVVWLVDEGSAAPAIVASFLVGGVLVYALTALRARPIVRWATSRTFGSLRLLVPIVSRALPLLLVFITFLFINAEAWQMTAHLAAGVLWLTVLLLTLLAVVFLLVRLPEEVDRVDDGVDDAFLLRTTRGTPVEGETQRLLAAGARPDRHAQVEGYDRVNLILVLLVVQIGQVLLLAAAVFAFFLLFGSLVMTKDVQDAWTQLPGGVDSFGFLPNASVELLKVSLFLAAFAGLYFTVSAITDETYRSQFFAAVTEELERAVGVRAVYLALHAEAGASG